MKILVTGACGMLGQDLCPILKNAGYDVIPTDIKDLNVLDEAKTDTFVEEKKPDFIIHCAAYTNVDKAEDDKEFARKLNVEGTGNVAKAAAKVGATMVYISTDYIFDGKKTTPYSPKDTPNPINFYGKTKFEGELEVKKHCTKHYIVRTSWLYGVFGKNFVETMISLKDNPEIKVVDDQTGCPTYAVDLSFGILKLIINQKPYGIYNVSGSGETSWYGFAKEIFKQMNLDANLKPCTTEEFPRKANRPKYSVLNSDNICPNWKVSLSKYIEQRRKIK